MKNDNQFVQICLLKRNFVIKIKIQSFKIKKQIKIIKTKQNKK